MNWCEYGSCWNCISYHLLIESFNKNRSNRRIWKCILENASVSSYMFDQTDENENTLQNWCKKQHCYPRLLGYYEKNSYQVKTKWFIWHFFQEQKGGQLMTKTTREYEKHTHSKQSPFQMEFINAK